jgi:hypothetical protein
VDANPVNHQASAWNDWFDVKVHTNEFEVQRMDNTTAGWGQSLVLNVGIKRSGAVSPSTAVTFVSLSVGTKVVVKAGPALSAIFADPNSQWSTGLSRSVNGNTEPRARHAGSPGTIAQCDAKDSTVQVAFGDSKNTKSWFTPEMLVLSGASSASAAPAVNARPSVGDMVEITGGNKRVGQRGKITKDDQDGNPYTISFNGTVDKYFKVAHVRKVTTNTQVLDNRSSQNL